MDQETTTREAEGSSAARPQRCAQCGGLNPPGAQWCGQCLARFDAPRPARRTPVASPPAPGPETTEEPPVASDPTETFRVTDEGIHWTCSVCDTVNDLDAPICKVCGAPFARTVLPAEERPQRDPNMTALISLFMPGAGHAYLGMWGQAAARAIVSLWSFMVVIVAALQRGAASSNLVMVVFGAITFALWGVSAHDAYREARDEKTLVILKGKIFFYLVLGLLLLLVGLLMSAMVKAQAS